MINRLLVLLESVLVSALTIAKEVAIDVRAYWAQAKLNR